MSAFVIVNCESGELRRYETGGTEFRLTHVAIPNGGPSVLTPQAVEAFRKEPSPDFSIEPPPQPPLPPADAEDWIEVPCDVEVTAA